MRFDARSEHIPTRLQVENNHLVAIPLHDQRPSPAAAMILAQPGAPCDALVLEQPVDFFIPEHVDDPTRLKPGQELWVEVTVPPTGPPRPLQLALKQNGKWSPLALQ
jgi:hypothetical protein